MADFNVDVTKIVGQVVREVTRDTRQQNTESENQEPKPKIPEGQEQERQVPAVRETQSVWVEKDKNGVNCYKVKSPSSGITGDLILDELGENAYRPAVRYQMGTSIVAERLRGEIMIPVADGQKSALGYLNNDGKFVIPRDGVFPTKTPGILSFSSGEYTTINLPVEAQQNTELLQSGKLPPKPTETQQTTKPQSTTPSNEETKNDTPTRENTIGRSVNFLSQSSDYIPLSDEAKYKIDLKYATADNFTNQNIYNQLKMAYVNKEMFPNLERASALLQERLPGAKFIVYDAARPLSAQQALWQAYPDPKFVSKPEKAAQGGGHVSGMSIDLGIIDRNGQVLNMGTRFDDFTEKAGSTPSFDRQLVKKGEITQTEADNRALLREVMMQAGFTPYPKEWWHFDVVPSSNREYQSLAKTVSDDISGYQQLYTQNKTFVINSGRYPAIP